MAEIGGWLDTMREWLREFPNHFQNKEIAADVRAIEAAHPQFELSA